MNISIWNILCIEPTDDTKEIKRAYARQLRLNHPEENPQGYQQLREAYSAALDYAKRLSSDILVREAPAVRSPHIDKVSEDVTTYIAYEDYSDEQKNVEPINLEQTYSEQTYNEQAEVVRPERKFNAEPVRVLSPTMEFDEFMEKVRGVYNNPVTRGDIRYWHEVMNLDTVWRLEYRVPLGYRMKDFLMVNYLLPKEIWELFDSYFYLGEMDEILYAFVKQNLYIAVRSGKLGAVKGVLENGVELEVVDSRGKTAIRYAVEHGYYDIVVELIKHKVNLEAMDEEGKTALIDGIINDKPEIVKCLLEHGANGNTADHKGKTALMYAAQSEDITMAELLLAWGADIEAADRINRKTAIRYAVISNKEKCLELLLKHGAKVEPRTREAITLFIIAVRAGNVAIMEILRKNGEDINQMDEDGISALAAAVEYNPVSVEYLIQHGADLKAKGEKSDAIRIAITRNKLEALEHLIVGGAEIKAWRSGVMNSLMLAASLGNTEIVKCLLDSGVPVNEGVFDMDYGRECTALFYAAVNGKEASVRLLLEYGAKDTCLNIIYASSAGLLDWVKHLIEIGKVDINEADEMDGATALIMAVKNSKMEVVQYLIEHGALINRSYKEISSPLIEAALIPDTELMDILITHGADLEFKTEDGFTVLLRCAAEGGEYSMKYLIDKGADIEARDMRGYTPLLTATINKKLYAVKYLLEMGADINVYDKDGDNALTYGVAVNQANIVHLLLKFGADYKLIDKKGRTYLHHAAVFGHLAMVKFFLKKGLSLNDRGDDGNTVLLEAAENDHMNIVEYILNGDEAFDINARNKKGYTALHYAVQNANDVMIQLLMHQDAIIIDADIKQQLHKISRRCL